MRNCADRVLDLIDELSNPSCVGLDPRIENIPEFLIKEALKEFDLKHGEINQNIKTAFKATAWVIERFNRMIIDATWDVVPAYKPQSAFYEQYKAPGMTALENTIRYIQSKGRIAITDAKRNDIEDTAQAYANAHLGVVPLITGIDVPAFNADMLTVNVYLGSDCVRPFIDTCKRHGKGIFLLVKTSNPSSQELQDMEFVETHGGRRVYEQLALKTENWGRELIGNRGYSSIGMVVGASGDTPEKVREQAKIIRRLNAYGLVLVPGYGRQGGFGIDVVPNFNGDGHGALVNNASDLIFAYLKDPYKSKYSPEDFTKATREAAIAMRDDIVGALREAKFKRWLQ